MTTYKVEIETISRQDGFQVAGSYAKKSDALRACRDFCGNHDRVRVVTSGGSVIQQTERVGLS
jgi:hypothetical protein